MPAGELVLQEPPTLMETVPDTSAVWTYLPMAMMSVSMMMMFMRSGGQSSGIFMYIALGMMVMAAGAMMIGQVMRKAGDRKQRLRGERRDYLRYLAQSRRTVQRAVIEQQLALAWRHPEPRVLRTMVRTTRLWERRVKDEDFGEVRIAVGDQQLAMRLTPVSSKPVEDLEPLCAHALRRFIRAYSTVPGQPIALYLRSWSRVLVHGDHDSARGMLRAALAQLALFHPPEELWIAVCAADEVRAEWEWVKWLPHNQHPQETDGAGPLRMVASAFTDLEDQLGSEFSERPAFDPDAVPGRDEPLVVVIVDGAAIPAGHRFDGPGYRNAVVVDLSDSLTWRPGRTTLRLDVSPDAVALVRTDRSRKEQSTVLGRPDRVGPVAAEALARLIAPYRMTLSSDAVEPLSNDTELTTLLGIADLHRLDPDTIWRRHTGSARLRVPVAVGADGRPVELDIKESAQGGMGPHGMLIGATGSGKSELLRTLVLGLALTNSSETLNFVLVDFKGGATFLGLDELPHTSAVITNLADEAALVERMQDALHGELIRRQELLRSAGNYTSALEYERARAGGADLAPLPSLFVVVDEFSELLASHREFMELFVMIGRLGRSLGVHLLLASQRLDEGRMHQLESHLSYRIGLRTFSAMESRGVLGVPDAYELPSQPGSGYLKSGIEALTRFRAAYVSGPYRRRGGAVAQARVATQVVPWSTGYIVPRAPAPAAIAAPEPEAEEAAESLLAVALDRLRDSGPPAHRVWLPPLDTASPLDVLLGGLAEDPDRGLSASRWVGAGKLRVPVGLVDKPFDQRRDPLVVDLAGAGGHVAVAGGSQSGKSTVLRSLIMALALTHTPREVQFYCLDFGGGTLSQLTGLPHVGGVAARLDTERISRTVAEVTAVLTQREQFFLDNGIDSMSTYRRRRAAGEFPDEPHGDIFLVIDGWSAVRQNFDQFIPTFNQIATSGLNYGIHLIVATARWLELTAPVRDQSATRLELRLGDTMDSVVDIRKASAVPQIPGRGLTVETKLHFLSALPRGDGSTDHETLSEGVADLVDRIASAWHGPRAPQVRMLPHRLPAAELAEPELGDGVSLKLALGQDEETLGTVWHDFSRTPHLVAVGDTESGKTNLLRLVADAVIARYTPAEARILVVDYRRGLVDAVPEEYRLGHAVALEALKQLVGGSAKALRTRVPGQEITPARMRQADWWTGPRLFVLVDDYDMVGGGTVMDHPFAPLFEHLALGHELGLHVVVARSATGAGRGLNDQLLRRLDEVNTPGILMSCSPSEGYVFGNVKPRVLPPGRALHIVRRKPSLIQTALAAGAEEEA
ncbi:type VII secretion protein EccCa [Streptomyces prunicolor]|uniref:type VII secretion protein EccCa n=1 Tax=Streptomyces prunicolor TaxID=67348 RepID=UPI00386F2465|nr:type VII secretion protein EccCa [Streptomyces prunicolor]